MMGEFWEFLIILLVSLLFLHYVKQLWSGRNYPPGPFQLPIIGGIWMMGAGFSHGILIKLAKRYGKIYTIWLGQKPIVVLSGYQAVKEAMIDRKDDFTDRPVVALIKTALNNLGLGIIFSSGDVWRQHRQFALVTLRKMGMGRQHLEILVEAEAGYLVEYFASTKGQPFEPFLPITNAVSNVINGIAFGSRYSIEDEVFKQRLENIGFISKYGTSITAVLYETLPWLMNYVPGLHQKAIHLIRKEVSFAMEEIEKHKEEQKCEPQDIVDYYLLQMEKSKGDPSSTYSKNNLAHCIIDLFAAGMETTATSLQWALLFMVAYPDIQDKVYKEIEDVFRSSQTIRYKDHKKLPYTNAVIHEILRVRYVLFFGLPRECVKDVNIRGYLIPKGTSKKKETVKSFDINVSTIKILIGSVHRGKTNHNGTFIIPDLRSVLLDPERWETPEQFNPHHFLDKEGNFIKKEEFLPFGIGARVCLGEHMAKMELFVFCTHLLRVFRFQLPEGVKELNQDPLLGFTMHPQPYKIRAIPRCNSS